jgi:PAS domain S-box-containing protein
LRVANVALESEVAERKAAEAHARELNAELEQRVEERTRELQALNERLRESESRMQAILDTAPPLVYIKDPDGRYQFLNLRFEKTLDVSREQVIGQTDHDLFPPDVADPIREIDRRVLADGKPVEAEEVAYRNGEKRTFFSMKFPLFDGAGKAYALCGMSTDITEHKRGEQALRQYNAELEQFAYIAAHDLQEPLRTVRTYSQWLSLRYGPALDDEGLEFMSYITGGVERMAQLVQDLRSYTEVAHQQHPVRETCDVAATLEATLQNMRASIAENEAQITWSTLPTVIANRGQLGQLFQNLISNAIKYRSEKTPRIEISATRDAHEWVFRVRDNGIGIEPQYAQQIFGVFKRLHGREIPGTGVGLAICKQIVEQHHGRIWVESVPGEGATFAFTLPA